MCGPTAKSSWDILQSSVEVSEVPSSTSLTDRYGSLGQQQPSCKRRTFMHGVQLCISCRSCTTDERR